MMVIASKLFMSYFEKTWNLKITDFEYGFGHSLGEIICGMHAGVLGFADTIKFVHQRQDLMCKYQKGKGGMAIFSKNEVEIKQMISNYKDIQISACNSNTSTSVAGNKDEIKRLVQENPGGKFLNIDLAVHSSLMNDALGPYKELLNSFDLKDPVTPILSFVDLELKKTKEDLKTSFL